MSILAIKEIGVLMAIMTFWSKFAGIVSILALKSISSYLAEVSISIFFQIVLFAQNL